jgi:hypothetical protein
MAFRWADGVPCVPTLSECHGIQPVGTGGQSRLRGGYPARRVGRSEYRYGFKAGSLYILNCR